MAFRIRRGLLANLGSMNPQPVEGELFYTTDTKGLYVGDASGEANLVSSSVVKVNDQIGIVELDTDDIPEGTTNLWYTDERAQDATALALLGATPVSAPDNTIHTRITFTYNDTTGRLSASVEPSGTVNTGTTNSLAYYTGNTAEVDDASELKWNSVSKTLSLEEGKIRITATSSTQYMTQFESFGDNQFGGWMVFRRARGTAAEPTVTQDQDFNASLIWASYDDSAPTSLDGYSFTAAISAGSDGGPSGFPGYYPGWLLFSVTGNGKVLQDVGRWDQFGKLTIGPYFGNEEATGALNVVQTVQADITPVAGFTNIFEDAAGPKVFLTKSRGTQVTLDTVETNDILGDLLWSGKDPGPSRISDYAIGARIRSTVNGTVGTGIVPADLTMSVANSTGTLVDTTRINNKGLSILTGALKLPVYADTSARDTALAAPEAGMLVFLTAGTKIQINTNSTTGGWVDLN